jgi:hypothetical protein
MVRTDTLTNIEQVGNIFILHCYFENNMAVDMIGNDIVGRGLFYFFF